MEKLQLHHLTVSQNGGIIPLSVDITLEFPDGYTDNSSLDFQYDVYSAEKLAPFSFPPGVRPVSSVLALHPENPDTEFLKPVKVTMPHCILLDTAESCKSIAFYKAKLSNGNTQLARKEIVFEKVLNEEVSLFTKICKSGDCDNWMVPFATLHTHHCCYYCIGEVIKADMDTAMFFLSQFIPKHLGKSSDILVHYTLSYFLQTCTVVSLSLVYLVCTYTVFLQIVSVETIQVQSDSGCKLRADTK